MANQSLYRKYRPQTFSDVVGQEHIEQTLRNALASDRVSHAYLFCGPRGTGKTTTARLLAKALLCDQAPTANPDGVCGNCTAIAEGTHPDVYELDAASRTGVDNVREEIIGRVAFSPTRGRFKVYIIDEVHMLSTAAFNALLKTLEEPPDHVVFVLCTTDPQKVPATIISRCQRFDFHKLADEQIVECLRQICDGEGFAYEPGSLELIAEQANGGMRDAITGLEQVAVFGNGTVTYSAAENMFGELDAMELSQIVELIAARDVAGCFDWVSTFSRTGIDVAQVAQSLTAYVRNLYVSLLVGGESVPAGIPAEKFDELFRQASLFGSADRLASMLIVLGDLSTELRTTADARLSLEIALTRMAHPASDLTLESLAARVVALEAGGLAPIASHVESGARSGRSTKPAEVADASAPAKAEEERPAAPLEQAAPAVVQPAAPAPDEDGAGRFMRDPSSLRRMWDSAVALAAKGHPMLPGLLGGARPHANVRESKITVELPADAIFALNALTDPDLKGDLVSALAKSFGGKVSLEYSLGAPGKKEAPSPEPRQAPVPAPEPDRISAPVQEPGREPGCVPVAEPRGEVAPSASVEVPYDDDDDYDQVPLEVLEAAPVVVPADIPSTDDSSEEQPDDDIAAMFRDVFGDGITITDVNG